MLFGLDLAVELAPVTLFLGQNIVAPALERRKSALDAAHLPAIEPNRDPGKIGKKAPVVTDDDERRVAVGEFALKPLDGRKVQVVGGLVQQQDIWRRPHHPHHPPPPPSPARYLPRL